MTKQFPPQDLLQNFFFSYSMPWLVPMATQPWLFLALGKMLGLSERRTVVAPILKGGAKESWFGILAYAYLSVCGCHFGWSL